MRYTQKLVDDIWDDSIDGLSRSEIADKRKLKWSQIDYVLKHKRPSQTLDYHHEDTSPTVVDEYTVDSQDVYTVDSNGDAKIETPESRLLDGFIKSIKDFYK